MLRIALFLLYAFAGHALASWPEAEWSALKEPLFRARESIELKAEVLPYIDDAGAKARAGLALERFVRTTRVDLGRAALLELSKAGDPMAKAAALYHAVGNELQAELATAVHFELKELPVVLSWLLSHPLTESETAGFEVTVWKCSKLNLLVAKVNLLLSTAGHPGDAYPPGTSITEGFSFDELKTWVTKQIATSLAKKSWSHEERDFLKGLLTRVKEAAQASLATPGHLIDFREGKWHVTSDSDQGNWIAWLGCVLVGSAGVIWLGSRRPAA